MFPSKRTYAFWLALLRIFVGVFWLVHVLPKFTTAGFMPPDGFFAQMVSTGMTHDSGPYRDFLANVVSPNVNLFAELVRFGELLVSLSLILGLFGRVGGLGGMFLTANYMLAKGQFGSFDGWTGLDGATFALSAINFVLPTGRMIGIDAFLGRKRAERFASAQATPASTPTVSTASGAPVQAEFVEERTPGNGGVPPAT
jgi:thiosulfate dehydrogenase [quinone] large subunit